MKRYLGVLVVLLMTNLGSMAVAQQNFEIDNVIINGGFEEGFQTDFGIGYGWGGFSNGSAVVGWNADSWPEVVVAGQYSQLIQIEKATEEDRLAGIYQTVEVVPGEPYKLTIKGLIRSQEGEVETSDYGYGLQYAIDREGGTTWEALPDEAWQDITWNEQPLYKTGNNQGYKIDTHQATITAENEQLTLFIRGWKKWVNEGAVVFNLDEVSLRGPVPGSASEAQVSTTSVEPTDDLEATTEKTSTRSGAEMTANTSEEDIMQVSHQAEESPADEETAVADTAEEIEPVTEDEAPQAPEPVAEMPADEESSVAVSDTSVEESADSESATTETTAEESETETTTPASADSVSKTEAVEAIPVAPEAETSTNAPVAEQTTEVASPAQLPTTGNGKDYPLVYLLGVGGGLLMILLTGATLALRQRIR